MSIPSFIFPENEVLYQQVRERAEIFRVSPSKINLLYLQPCRVKVLLVTDGDLDYGIGDFGLSTFVSILQRDGRNYVKFDITLAHRENVSDARIQMGAPDIARSIRNFRFSTPDHFTDNLYDQVWLFGYSQTTPITVDEQRALSSFMNKGGGVFATGDHASIGSSLCGSVTRVRSMRHWSDFNNGEVSMDTPKRNDTNRGGHDAGTQFDDQSDDIPQTIQPTLYSSVISNYWKETYPHPILCSPTGKITVLPDHPHEGECRVPASLTQTYIDGTPEYPLGISPEIIATSTVPAGNTASTKQATVAHSFGAICAYDGHLAKVGRVVTDATWHHFVNINLIGELYENPRDAGQPEDESKKREAAGTASTHGFLYSVEGQNAFAKIKHYYVNIAVWISRSTNITCFNRPMVWNLLYHHRVIEATMDNPNVQLEQMSLRSLYAIGSHARDVLGKIATPCRRLRFLIDLIRIPLPKFAIDIDPWIPQVRPDNPPLPWFDVNPLFNVVLGAGLVAVREKFRNLDKAPDESQEKEILPVFNEGVKKGIEVSLKAFDNDFSRYMKFR